MAEGAGERLLIALVLLAGAAASILAQGFALPSGINAYHFPVLFGWVGSAEGPHDPFIASLDHFVTFFWPTLGLLVDETNWTWVLPLVHLSLRFLTGLALYLIFDALVAQRRAWALLLAAVLPLGLAFFVESPLGHGEVLLDNLSHSSANPPLALFIAFCATTRRWIAAGLLLGLLFNINAFVAAWLALAVVTAFLLAERRRLGPALRRQGLPALALALLLALPTAWRIWQTLAETAPELAPYDFRQFLREFYAGHFFPDATGAGGWLRFALLLASLGWLAAMLAPLLSRQAFAAWCGLVLGLAAVVLLGIALPYVSGSRLLLNAHPLRLDFLLVWLAYLGFGLWSLARARIDAAVLVVWLALFAGFWLTFAVLLSLLLTEDRRFTALFLLLLAAAVALLGSLPADTFGPPRLVRALDLLLLLAALPFLPYERFWAPCLALLAALTLSSAASAPWLSALTLLLPVAALAPWPGRAAAARLLPWLFVALGLAAAWLLRNERSVALLLAGAPLAPMLLGILLAKRGWPTGLERRLAACGLLLAALAALVPGLRHLEATGRIDRYDAAALDFLAAQRWARAETPPGSVFLAPESQLRPNLVPSFWTLSRRSVWVDWRMGAGAHWLPDFYWLWHERMAETAALGDAEAKLAYARAKGIDYVILEQATPAQSGVVYANEHYTVLEVAP
ncbi:MAG TPA: hypothetical protein VJL84_07255 [Kiloniellales bacterium]|nr:hypothetical protein [Kiloniellales bacterium]